MSPVEKLRAALQEILDTEGEGWQVDAFVICLGLERISDGTVESTPWIWMPAEQPDWVTDGLLNASQDLRYITEVDSD